MIRIESLLSARLFMVPQSVGDRIFFFSNLSGKLSLYAMDHGGSVPEPLLPPHIALQNPHLIGGRSFYVFPKLASILVMIDKDGDENYQPNLIPLQGGFPEPAFGNFFSPFRVHLGECDPDENILYLTAESRKESLRTTYQCNLATGEFTPIYESKYGGYPAGVNANHSKVVLAEGYTMGDIVLFLWQKGQITRSLYGLPLEQRVSGQEAPLTGFISSLITPHDRGVLLGTVLFDDHYSPGYFPLDDPKQVYPVAIHGLFHQGLGELEDIRPLKGNLYLLQYNIDGCTWLYEAIFDEDALVMTVKAPICGVGMLSNGVLESVHYDRGSDRFTLSFSTATSPTQIFTVEGSGRDAIIRHTNEHILGIDSKLLSSGEDASFTSFDGTRLSARLYLPSPTLGFHVPHPVVYYIHGGPQSQERPDFAWFSMPLIQLLTLNGFAVFVPNVRGSTGYGLSYAKQVDRDWGGRDRLDHVHAMTEILPKDTRLDSQRTGVVGRSYGGYMTLTLASRHPDLWSAAVDMFGPYDLLTFLDRLPETWKPYFTLALADPAEEQGRAFLIERSPASYIDNITCPLFVIQGRNDPRVVERESRDVVEGLRQKGKQVDFLLFENEGHDVLKYENRVTCYNTIVEFFKKTLTP